MTISTEPYPIPYAGNGSTTAFPITWKYFAKSHVVATLRSSSGTETLWVLDTDYTLTAAGVDAGGTLTATTAPASGTTLFIDLDPPNTQTSSLPLGGAFPSTTVEAAADIAAQRDAKLEALFNRALRVPKTDTESGSDLELPIDSVRASKFLAFNSSGNPIASAGPTGNSSIPVSAFIETLLDDITATEAKQTLLLDKHGADIASASTLNFDTSTGDLIDVTGAVTITGITLSEGQERTVRFTGSLLLTHGSNLILPDSTSIQTAAGDYAVFRGYASSVVRCVSYNRLQRHGSDVASATTTNLDTATGDLIDVTGTTTITGITLAEGRERTVRFTGALTLTHGASLVLPGAANITTVAGDFAIFRGYAAGVVRCISYSPPVTKLSGDTIQTVNQQTGAVVTGTTTIPADDTIPQITEGDEYLSVSVTPTNASNKLFIQVIITFANSFAGGYGSAALFDNPTASAICAQMQYLAAADRPVTFSFNYYMTAGTTSTKSFRVRAGADSAGTTTLNGFGGNRKLGGMFLSSITVTELKV